jgi:uncharacterized membrane protein
MKQKKVISTLIGLLLIVIGVIEAIFTRDAALASDAPLGSTIAFALSLLLVLAGILVIVIGLLPKAKPVNIRTLSLAALFAALCYIGFTYCKIDISVSGESTAFHLGNVFCVMAALLLGGFWGGMAGAVGMTLADLTTAYVTSAPKTFFLKLCIGLIVGFFAHKIFHLSEEKERKIPLPVATVISCSAGMLFNIIADPLVGYLYKTYIFGIPQDIAKALEKISRLTTSVNAVIAVIAATLLYLALRRAMARTNLLPKL